MQGLGGNDSSKGGSRARSEYRKETNSNIDIKSQGLVRDRSSRRRGEGDDSASNIDVISLGSRRQAGFNEYSPNKDQMSQDDNSYIHGTPQIGNQIFIQDMNIQYQSEETRQLATDLQGLKDRYRKIEGDWQKRIDDSKSQNLTDLEKLVKKHKEAETLLVENKDQIRNSIQETLDKERLRMDELHKVDLD